MKVLLVAVVVGVVLWLMLRRRPRSNGAGPAGPGGEGSQPPEGLLACARCGVRLPASEALPSGGLAFCSAAHREAGPRAE